MAIARRFLTNLLHPSFIDSVFLSFRSLFSITTLIKPIQVFIHLERSCNLLVENRLLVPRGQYWFRHQNVSKVSSALPSRQASILFISKMCSFRSKSSFVFLGLSNLRTAPFLVHWQKHGRVISRDEKVSKTPCGRINMNLKFCFAPKLTPLAW
jgi:hypothetical protein